ncbi:hypothetical protein D3C81_1743330 [compost metagenome]
MRRHVQPECVATTGDLLHHPIALNHFSMRLRLNAREQRPQRQMRWGKSRQIVMAKRQRFAQLQRAGQRAEMLTGEMGKGAAR